MVDLKGTKTEKNLEAAFAGESQAHTKYQYFASQASKEGYKHVQQGGYILVEIGYNQKESVINIFKSEGKYADIKCIQDLNGKDRVIEVKVE